MQKTIICVDDERIVLTGLMSQLRVTLGKTYRCEGFVSVEEASKFIDELENDGAPVDLIICDQRMPYVCGDEFLIHLRERLPNVQMIMLSGQADAESIERARTKAGLFKFIPKPWIKEELMIWVRQALDIKDINETNK